MCSPQVEAFFPLQGRNKDANASDLISGEATFEGSTDSVLEGSRGKTPASELSTSVDKARLSGPVIPLWPDSTFPVSFHAQRAP